MIKVGFELAWLGSEVGCQMSLTGHMDESKTENLSCRIWWIVIGSRILCNRFMARSYGRLFLGGYSGRGGTFAQEYGMRVTPRHQGRTECIKFFERII